MSGSMGSLAAPSLLHCNTTGIVAGQDKLPHLWAIVPVLERSRGRGPQTRPEIVPGRGNAALASLRPFAYEPALQNRPASKGCRGGSFRSFRCERDFMSRILP